MRFRKIGVVGSTPTALGVTECVASQNLDVIVVDPRGNRLKRIERDIELSLQQRLEKWDITESEMRSMLGRISITQELEALAEVDFVLDCTVDSLQEKQRIFTKLDKLCRPDVILSSNTSTLSITEVAAATDRPELVIGTHFSQPVARAELVELVRGLHTSDDTMQKTRLLMQRLGKVAIEVYESAGYVTTRLIVPLINEAILTLVEGVANVDEIDLAMRLGYGMRQGPLEMCDRMGLDTVLLVMERLFREYGDTKYRPNALLKKLVRAGHTGVGAGRGFYHYDEQGNRLEPAVQGSTGGALL